MRKIALLIVTGLLGAALLTGCGAKKDTSSETATAADTSSANSAGQSKETPETFGDIYNTPGYTENGSSCYDNKFILAYEADGIYYRAIADLTDEQSKTINDAYGTEDFDVKIKAATESLKVSSFENLSDTIPSQEEMDKWIGMTGEELLDDGWTVWGYDLENMEFNMGKGAFIYIITFDGSISEFSDENEYPELKPCKVTSVKFDGLGEATTLYE